MNPASRQEKIAGCVAWLYCLWQARALSHAWMHSPYDRMGLPAFLIWCAPAVWGLLRGGPARQSFFVAGVLVSLAGSLGEVNAVKYVGLALASAGFLRPGLVSWCWLAAAVSWMPVLGFALSSAGQPAVHALRLVLSVCAAVLALRPPAFLSTASSK